MEETPLLDDLIKSSTFHEGCPGCLLELKKDASVQAPVKNLCIVALLVLSNILPVASLFPFIYFMVRDFGIAKVTTQIGTYAGYIGSAIMVGSFITSAPWGMVADRYGRKPVMMIGTASIVVFNTLFGFSTNFWLALSSRFLLGFLNGMLGPVRAYASEICREEHQALGLSMVGTMWGAGMIVGPAIGGYLAQPAEQYPSLFPSGSLFHLYPYALPCLCISAFAVVALVASFFLPESLHNHPTVVIGDVKIGKYAEENIPSDTKLEKRVEGSKSDAPVVEKPLWRNWGMIAACAAYCLWGLHDMAYSEIFSLWAVSPEVYGGLAYTSSQVANMLAIGGLALLLFQLFVFPQLAKMSKPIQMTRVPTALTIPLLMVHPLMSKLSGTVRLEVLTLAVIMKNLLSVCIATGTFFLINNSVVTAQRGAANGISMSGMSLFRAIGPACAGVLFSWAQERDTGFMPGLWMVFFIMSVVCFIAFIATFDPILPRALNDPIPEGRVQDDPNIKRLPSFTIGLH